MKHNPSFQGVLDGGVEINTGITQNLSNNIHFLDFLIPNNNSPQEMFPNIPAICERLDQLSPKELYAFARYTNSLSGGGKILQLIQLLE